MSATTTPEPTGSSTPTADDAPITIRLVDRLGRALAGSGLSRRRFLSRVAVVGAAVAVDPIRYAIKPGSAYAQVCGDGASCGSGWTAFCCTVNSGRNTCPNGSYVAGWWRIDDSPFCLGAARYVIDCNRSPNASCSCRCASGTCDQRRVCCNNFRYGQCNTQIAGVTEVVCRVVTCTAPWVWDPACNRTVRVDNRTRSHNAPCLPGRNATRIDIKYQDMGMRGSVLGAPTSPERDGPRGGRYRRYENGTIFYRSNVGANALHGAMNDAHRELGGASGPLRYPRTDVHAVGDGAGLQVRFENGSLYARNSSATPVPVYAPIDATYRDSRGGPRGSLGYPTSTSRRGDGSTLTRFANGILAAVAGAPVVSTNPNAFAAAVAPPSSSPDRVGWPIAAEQGSGATVMQRYEHGIVALSSSGWIAVGSDLADRWLRAGGPGGSLGQPTGAPSSVAGGRGRMLSFASAAIYAGPAGVFLLSGAALTAYRAEDGANGWLGLPTSEAVSVPNGQRRVSFENGAIIIEPNGSASVLELRSGRPPSQLQRTSPTGASPRGGRNPSELTR